MEIPFYPNEERDCPACDSAHSTDTEALNCVGKAWLLQNMTIISLQAQVQELKGRLDAANDVVWDEASGAIFDVEHFLSCHAEDVPTYYRQCATALEKIRDITNYHPDPEEVNATPNQD